MGSLISDSASFRLESFTLDQQLCKRVCRGLKTGAIEHNFVRLTKEQVSSGGFSLLCAAQCPDPSHHNTTHSVCRAESRPEHSKVQTTSCRPASPVTPSEMSLVLSLLM